MYIVGLMYNDWLREQEAANARVYDDPHREMLRVAGEGAWLAERYEFLADLYVTAWSFGIPDPCLTKPADGRIFAEHSLKMMMQRGVTFDVVRAVIRSGARYWDTKEQAWSFFGEVNGRRIYVAVSEETGKIATTYPRSRLLTTRWIPIR
jgi:hypothetical protein